MKAARRGIIGSLRPLLIVAVVAAGLVPLPAEAQAPDPGADAQVSQFAYATNIIRQNGSDYMYIVGAERTTRANGRTRTTAYAKRAKCLTLEKKRIKLIACAAFVFPRRIPDSAFEFDPLLDSARVRMKNKDGSSAMRWAGRGTPEPYAAPYADPSYGGGVYAEVYRGARAKGKILGQRYPRGGFGFALLIEGAMADGYAARNVSVTRTKGGAYKFVARYRIPR